MSARWSRIARIRGPGPPKIARGGSPRWGAGEGRLELGPDGPTIPLRVFVMPAPRSYTGEDMLEVSVHGSPYVVEAAIASFVAAGARPAAAGEFTRRAVANGKLEEAKEQTQHLTILAPQDGEIKHVAVQQGEAVEKKSLLVEFKS